MKNHTYVLILQKNTFLLFIHSNYFVQVECMCIVYARVETGKYGSHCKLAERVEERLNGRVSPLLVRQATSSIKDEATTEQQLFEQLIYRCCSARPCH